MDLLLEYAAYRDRDHSFANSASGGATIFQPDRAWRADACAGAAIMADYLTILGTKPVRGRPFAAEEDRPGGQSVALISYALWQKKFGGSSAGDPVNRLISMDAATTLSVNATGIRSAWSKRHFGCRFRSRSMIFLSQSSATIPSYEIVARLKPGVELQQADTELKAIARQHRAGYPPFAAAGA